MIYTPKIEKTIQKVAILHDGQKRKGEAKPPYVTHLFSVALLLGEYTDDEDTIVAGLLHDSVEDTDYTKDELERDFGPHIAKIVMGVTEEKERGGKKLPWKERKVSYLKNLQKAPKESLMVSAADKIHNLHSALGELDQLKDVMSSDTITKESYLWYHEEVLKIIEERLDNPLISKFREVLAKTEKMLV